jgi:hypothetical protein
VFLFQNRVNDNYELVVREAEQLRHYWFAWEGDRQWHQGEAFGRAVQSAPALFQQHFSLAKDYEVVVGEGDRLRHYWFAFIGGDRHWHPGQAFGTRSHDAPVLVQNRVANTDETYNYELVAWEGDRLQHYWFAAGEDRQWHPGQAFGAQVRAAPVLVQNRVNGNYELVVREADGLRHYWFAWESDGHWHRGQQLG